MTTPQQLKASEIDLKLAPSQFCERLCLVKTSPNTDFAFTPGREGPNVSMNQLWPALKFNTHKELMDQLKIDDGKSVGRIKAKVTVAANKLARNAGIPLTSAGFAYLLGKGCDNFLVLLKKNDINGDLVEKGVIFDFFDHMNEMESGTGYCSSTEFQHAFKIAMARMEEDVDEAADDLVNMGGVVTSAKKTVHTEQEQLKPVQPIHEQVENPLVPSPNGKAGDVPVETVEFKVANASDTSTFGNDGEASEPKTPVSDKVTADKPMDFAELWNKLKEKGWGHKSGDNLVDWYWVQPEYEGLGKREMLERGTLGRDYFIDQESVMRYAKTHLGLRVMVETPGSEKKAGVHQRRGRKRSAAAAITVEPTVEKKKKEEKKKCGKKKKKPVESPMSVSSRFSMGQLSVDQSVTMSEAEMNIGVSKKKQDSARKNVTYVKTYNEQDADDERENPENAESDNDGESKNTEDETESEDGTFEVMGSHEAWRMLMAHFEFKFHQGKYYCLPGKENKPGDNSSAIEGRHYFSSLMDLRKHLCAFGLPKCKLFMSKSESDALSRWVRYTNFTGLSASGSTYINPTDFGELLSFREAWAMLLQLGLRYTGGYYIVDDPDPSKEPKKFERPEQMLVHLARFGIPNIQGVSHDAGLDDNDRLRLDLYIAGTEINSYKRIDPDKENINEITPRRSRNKRSSDAAVELSNEQNLPKQSSPEPKQALGHREYQMSFNALEAQRQIDLRQVDSKTSFELLTEYYNFHESTSYESTSSVYYGDTYYCFPGVNLTDEFKLGVHFFHNMQDLRKYLCAYGLPPRSKRVKKQPSEGDLELLEQWIRSAHIQEPYDESAIISEKMKPKEVKRILKELGYEFNKKHNFYLLPGVSSHESNVGKDRFENLIDLFNHIARFGLSSREGSLNVSVDLQRLQLFIASVATHDISQQIECSEPLPKQAPSASKVPAVATKQSEYEHNASELSVETPKQVPVPVVLDQEDTPEPKETPPPKKNPGILKFLSKTVTTVADGVSSVVKGARTHSVDCQLTQNDAQKDDMNRSLQHNDSDEVFESISTSLPLETKEDAMGDSSEASAQLDEKKEKVEFSLSSDQINMPWVELWKEMKAQGWRHTTGDLRVSYFYINSKCAGMKKKEVLSGTKGIDYFESEEEIQAYAKKYLGWKGVKEFSTPGEAHFSSPEDLARHSEKSVAFGDSLSRSQANMPWAELWKEMKAQGWRHTNGDGLISYIYINSKCFGMKKADVLRGTKGIDYFESEEEIQAYAKKYLGWKGVKEFSTPGETLLSSTDSFPTTKRKEVPASALPDSKKSRIEKNTQVTTTPKKPHARRNTAPSSAGSKESSSSLKSVSSEDSHIPVPDLQLTYKDKLEYCKLTLHPSYAPKKERLSTTSNSKVQELENEIKTFMMRAMKTNYVFDGMTAQSPGFLYICGGPGTGKTTAVTACSQQLSKWSKDGGFAKPCYCHINMASNAPMNGDGVMKHMLKTMAKKLQIDKNSNLPAFKKQIEKKGMILVIDEIDMLFKNGGGSGEGWFTTLIEWSEDKDLAFSMIGISNSVNDVSATKIRDLGHCPHELVFPTYNDADLLAILEKRIGKKIVDNKALQLISKRVAASTGDARKALEITSNAIDKALDAIGEETMRKEVEDDGVYPLVKLPHMMRAIREGMPTRHEEIIRGLPQAQKVILCIAVSLGKVWGPTASVSIADLKKFAVQATHRSMLDVAHIGQITNIVETLMDSGLLTTDHDGCSNFNPNDPSSRLHIGVQLDDVEIALEKSLLGEDFYRSLVDYVKRECPQPSMR